jgi:acyl transferase domain-containing protein
MDLRGPSLIVDTACSSGLVAIHSAAASLNAGDCDLAIVGGVNVLIPDVTYTLSCSGFLSPTGKCHTFASSADGYIRGEACGFVILRRKGDSTIASVLDKTNELNDVYAELIGSALNQDGTGIGLTAPNPEAQEGVLRRAYKVAGVAPSSVAYVEAHGTGTALGDPIEAEAIGSVLSDRGARTFDCPVGSLKSNIGHCEAAAGIMGFIKAALVCKYRTIPPSLHVERDGVNTKIPFRSARVPLYVPVAVTALCEDTSLPPVGVSSFGFGGCNAHAVLQPAPHKREVSEVALGESNYHVLLLSARSSGALKLAAQNALSFLESSPHKLPELCATMLYRRPVYSPFLWAVCGSDAQSVIKRLRNSVPKELLTKKVSKSKKNNQSYLESNKVLFMFTGQGSQYFKMGEKLYMNFEVFRNSFDKIANIASSRYSIDLHAVLGFKPSNINYDINDTLYTQPAIFALQIALGDLWISFGVYPSAVIG